MIDRQFYIGCDVLFLTNSGVMRCRDEATADILTQQEVIELVSSTGVPAQGGIEGFLTFRDVNEVYPHVALALASAWGVKQVIRVVSKL